MRSRQGAVSYRLIAWFACGLLAVLTGFGLVATRPAELPRPRAEVKGAILKLEVARSSADQVRGLSDHAPLAQHDAMLFPRMTNSDRQCFWMKDMTFPIDIVWLDKSNRITKITQHFAPDSYPRSECGPAGTSYALELRAGSVKHFTLEQGDHVELTL